MPLAVPIGFPSVLARAA